MCRVCWTSLKQDTFYASFKAIELESNVQSTMVEDSVCIADDEDFASLKQLVDNDDGWTLEVAKANTLVWTRTVPGCNFQMVKINSRFEDIEPDCVFDVLLDPDYRKEWDSHMLESYDIGNFNVNNDVGYYASE